MNGRFCGLCFEKDDENWILDFGIEFFSVFRESLISFSIHLGKINGHQSLIRQSRSVDRHLL
jgi:hypothetical protein